MSFANWKKRQKVIGKYLPEGYHAMAELIANAAYKAGERAGREQVETDQVRSTSLNEREQCARFCEAKANALGERADLCDDDEDAIELKARAWQMAVLAAELREQKQNDRAS